VINSQNIQGAQKNKLKKINDTMKKWTNELNKAFSKAEDQMAKKTREEMLRSLAIKEIQMKTTLRFYLTPNRNATIKNTNNNTYW
jgi:archaellum biogenesis protein FlaJ (TadC family)